MTSNITLEENFLSSLVGKKVSIFLVNGIKLNGSIGKHGDDVITLRNNSITQMVYKNAISTIVPSAPLENDAADYEEDEV